MVAETSRDIPSRSIFRTPYAIKSEWPCSFADLNAAMADVARVTAETPRTITFIIYFLREISPSSRLFDRQFVPTQFDPVEHSGELVAAFCRPPDPVNNPSQPIVPQLSNYCCFALSSLSTAHYVLCRRCMRAAAMSASRHPIITTEILRLDEFSPLDHFLPECCSTALWTGGSELCSSV